MEGSITEGRAERLWLGGQQKAPPGLWCSEGQPRALTIRATWPASSPVTSGSARLTPRACCDLAPQPPGHSCCRNL